MKASQKSFATNDVVQAVSKTTACDLDLIFEIEELDTRLEMSQPTRSGSSSGGRCNG